MYQHLLKQTKHDVGVIVSISLMMTLIFGVIVYNSFMHEYTVKKNSDCYKETQNIFCYDQKIQYWLGFDENEITGGGRNGSNSSSDWPTSLTYSNGLLLSLYMLIVSGYAFFKKYHTKI